MQSRKSHSQTHHHHSSAGPSGSKEHRLPNGRPFSSVVFAIPVLLIAAVVASFYSYSSFSAMRFAAEDLMCRVRESVQMEPGSDTLLKQYDHMFSGKTAGGGWQPEFFSREHNVSLFWGTYRPGVLMGVRSRADESLLFGIAWFDRERRHDVRHHAVDSRTLVFKWVVHDGRYYGRQEIVDLDNNLRLDILFIKHPNGKDWAVRVTSSRLVRSAATPSINVAVYFANDAGPSFPVDVAPVSDNKDGEDAVAVFGELKMQPASHLPEDAPKDEVRTTDLMNLNAFRAVVSDVCFNRSAWKVATTSRSQGAAWNIDIQHLVASAKTMLHRSESNSKIDPKSNKKKGSNVVLLHKLYDTDFRFEVSFSSRHNAEPQQHTKDHESSFYHFTSCQITSAAIHLEQRFHTKFAAVFPFMNIAGLDRMPPTHGLVTMAESALSNMIGGLGYWTGQHRVVRRELDEAADAKGRDLLPQEAQLIQLDPPGPYVFELQHKFRLFSGVPSRAKFPRGFLWDEGFHQLLIGKWDAQISFDVISHWIVGAKTNFSDPSMESARGWIPREQILGGEARTRIPSEFLAQHPTHANPPSFILQIQNFASAASTDEDFNFLERLIPHLRQWRDWYHTSQCGGSPDCAKNRTVLSSPSFDIRRDLQYRWRSKNRFHLLASGLDDYPRPICKALHRRVLHVDLFCWMWLLTSTLEEIERRVSASGRTRVSSSLVEGRNVDAGSNMRILHSDWIKQLDTIHWDGENKKYSDTMGCKGAEMTAPKQFSGFVGYVNLFPLLTMIIEDREKALGIILLAKRSLLSNGFGLQSLSERSRELLKESRTEHENYWTGPIWLNINFMFLRALKLKYNALVGQEAVQMYKTVRADLIRNLAKEYEATGNLWENYHWVTGAGQGTSPFTGWSALIVLILAEQY
jgi:mannosyl-oligosaccharide glucosidase